MARILAFLMRVLDRSACACLLALFAYGAIPAAANTAITVPSLGAGFNYYQGSYSLGWSFTTNTAIQVTALGFYDDLQNGLAQSHPVGIYDKATQALLASVTVVPTDPLTGYFRFAPLATPLTLSPGNTYVVMALVGRENYLAFANIDPLWTVDPAITYGQNAVNYANSSATTLLFPDTFAAGGDFGPNFQFTAPPAVTVSPASLAFGSQPLFVTSAPQASTLSNAGTAVLNIAGITVSGDFAIASGCGTTLAIGANCSISTTFTPLAAGARTGQITITSDAPGSPHAVALSGNGISATSPNISFAPSALAFAPITAGSASRTLSATLANPGNSALAINAIGVTAPTSASRTTVVPRSRQVPPASYS